MSIDARVNPSISILDTLEGNTPNKRFIGTFIVARRDGKALLPGHLEALCAYAWHLIKECMEQNASRELFLGYRASKEDFLGFFKKWCAENPDESLRELASPYDL